jgi:general secretion pathway protein I
MHSEHLKRPGGFTLLEVLVALVIVGLGLMAVFSQLNQTIMTASMLRDRTLAHWVAVDRITELRLEGILPEVGERSDEIEMAGAEWAYTLKFSDVGVENFVRVDVSVGFADNPDRVVTELAGFLGERPPVQTASGFFPGNPNGGGLLGLDGQPLGGSGTSGDGSGDQRGRGAFGVDSDAEDNPL